MIKIYLLFYMCHFAMGLTHCYKTTVFLHLFLVLFQRWKYLENLLIIDKVITTSLVYYFLGDSVTLHNAVNSRKLLTAAGNSLAYQSGSKFGTMDKDARRKCARSFAGAWWYPRRGCFRCQLTGAYLFGKTHTHWKGVVWFHWKGETYSLKSAEMKIRPFYA